MTEDCDCPGCMIEAEEVAALQISSIVNLVRLKRRREREKGHAYCVAILEDGIVDALRAWDPPKQVVRMH